MIIKINKNKIRIALYIYTFFLIVTSVFLALGFTSNSDRKALAQGCTPTYTDGGFKFVGDDCSGYDVYRCSTGYTLQLENSCFVNENCQFVEKAVIGKDYTADPGIGQCVQVDFRPVNDPDGGGGVCGCQPPEEPPVEPPVNVQCNQVCNNSNLLCPSNLSCINVDGENRCRLPANPTAANCLPVVENPSYSIDKMIEGGNTSYNIGDIVTFRIRMSNTGNIAFTNLKFRDVYNANYLTYVGGSASKSTGGSIADINTVLTRNTSGTIEIENITSNSVLGTLAPGAYIDVIVRFIAKAPVNETCNYGYIQALNLPEISDNACTNAKNIDTDL